MLIPVRFIPYVLGGCFFAFVFLTTGSWQWGVVIGGVVLALGLYPEHSQRRLKRRVKRASRKSRVGTLTLRIPFPFRIFRSS